MKGRLPIGPARTAIRQRQSPHTVHEVTVSKGNMGQDVTDKTERNEPAHLYLYRPGESEVQVPGGIRTEGSLQGLAVNDFEGIQPNIEVSDHLTYGGVEYELVSMTGVHRDEDPPLYRLRFERVEHE